MADLSIVIVNWNVRALLRRCLQSVVAPAKPCPADGVWNIGDWRLEIIVVDNASSDGSPDMLRAEFPMVRLIANDENRGFTAANNQGLALAQGRYVLLLNPDTEVVGDALAAMLGYMDTHPETGALGPKLVYPDGSLQASRRRFPTFLTALVESTVVQEWWSDNWILRHYYIADVPDDAIQPVDWVVGACLLIRREAYEQVGGLDEGFFMYSEEMDWCRRIKSAGWQVVYLSTTTVIHHEGKSSEQVVPARHIHFQSSKVRYFRKHHGTFQAETLRWFLLSTYVYQLGREGFKWLVGHKRPLRAERVRAYYQVLKSGLRGSL
ncbi:MAG TPA: glycosyltransferase family 2 protein [Anaerolineae bacterium]|nr:glycosyltransferase family 2 protein [Anaerolineae bacterium]